MKAFTIQKSKDETQPTQVNFYSTVEIKLNITNPVEIKLNVAHLVEKC